jgi:hypothetical protein
LKGSRVVLVACCRCDAIGDVPVGMPLLLPVIVNLLHHIRRVEYMVRVGVRSAAVDMSAFSMLLLVGHAVHETGIAHDAAIVFRNRILHECERCNLESLATLVSRLDVSGRVIGEDDHREVVNGSPESIAYLDRELFLAAVGALEEDSEIRSEVQKVVRRALQATASSAPFQTMPGGRVVLVGVDAGNFDVARIDGDRREVDKGWIGGRMGPRTTRATLVGTR